MFYRRDKEGETQFKVEADMAARVAERAEEIVASKMQSEEMQKIVERRLREERARLEQKVCTYLHCFQPWGLDLGKHPAETV